MTFLIQVIQKTAKLTVIKKLSIKKQTCLFLVWQLLRGAISHFWVPQAGVKTFENAPQGAIGSIAPDINSVELLCTYSEPQFKVICIDLYLYLVERPVLHV